MLGSWMFIVFSPFEGYQQLPSKLLGVVPARGTPSRLPDGDPVAGNQYSRGPKLAGVTGCPLARMGAKIAVCPGCGAARARANPCRIFRNRARASGAPLIRDRQGTCLYGPGSAAHRGGTAC